MCHFLLTEEKVMFSVESGVRKGMLGLWNRAVNTENNCWNHISRR